MTRLDCDWLSAHPLPALPEHTDKNDRGRVLVVGGSKRVPGALRLTGEAALRAGAGKLQMATVSDAAIALGVQVPEAAVVALPAGADGEIDARGCPDLLDQVLGNCDTLVLGPGMSANDGSAALVSALLRRLSPEATVLLDAAAIDACRDCAAAVRTHPGHVLLTPHPGEMAALTGHNADWITNHMVDVAGNVAADLDATVVLKSSETVICATGGAPLLYPGGGPALATGGSGDVLAGVLGGLLARGADPFRAAAWAVWTHGEAGRTLTERLGGPGLLARELPGEVPRLLASVGRENGAAGED